MSNSPSSSPTSFPIAFVPSKILILDDDPGYLRTLTDIFAMQGYLPFGFSEIEPAVAWAKENKPSLALVDLRLDNSSGLSAVAEIRSASSLTECIVMTGYATQESAINAVNLGAYSYVLKPFDMDQFLVIVRRALERQRNRKALLESELRYRTIFDAIPDAVIIEAISDGRILHVNTAACEMYGYSRAEFLSKKAFDLVDKPDELVWPEEPEMQTLPKTAIRTNNVRASGEIFPIEGHFRLQKIGDQKALMAVIRDLSQIQQYEQRLRLQDSILDAVANAILITDTAGNITWVNPAFERLTGYSYDEVLGETPHILYSGAHGDEFFEDLWGSIRAGKVWQNEIQNRKKNGELYTELMTITPLQDDRGDSLSYIAVKQDITDSINAREAIERQNRELALLNQVIVAGATATNVTAVLEVAAKALANAFGLGCVRIFMYEKGQKTLDKGAQSCSLVNCQLPNRIQIRNSIFGLALENQVVRVSERSEAYAKQYHAQLKKDGFLDTILFPMALREQVVGAVQLLFEKESMLSVDDFALIMNVCSVTAQIIENARLAEEQENHVHFLEALEQISQVILGIETLEDIPPQLMFAFANMFKADCAYLVLREENKKAEVLAEFRQDDVALGKRNQLDLDQILNKIDQTREPVVMTTPSEYLRMEASETCPLCMLGFPLSRNGTLIGSALLAFEQVRSFNQKQLSNGMQAASQISIALGRAILLDSIRVRNIELETLTSVSGAMRTAVTQEELLPIVLEQMSVLLTVDGGTIGLLDEQGDLLVVEASGLFSHLVNRVVPKKQGMSAQVIETREIIGVEDSLNAPSIFFQDAVQISDSLHLLGIPIYTHDQILGVSWVGRKQAFTDGEENLLRAIMNMVSSALQRMQLLSEIEQRAELISSQNEELSRLYQASAALVMDVMSVQGLSQQIVEAVLEEFGQSNCSLLLRNEQEGQIDRIAVAGPYKNKVAKGTLELDGVGMVPTVMRTGKLWNVGDVRLEDNYVPNWPEARSELAIPLKIGERIIGAIDIQSTHRNAFGPNDERILGLFAERAALALENASYQEQTRQRAEQLATVGRIGRELGQLLDLPSIYPEFARALIDLLDQTSAITISHYITQESGLRTVFGYEHDHEMSEARLTSLAEFSQRTGYPITAILTQRPHVISQIQILELDDESGSVPENFTYKSMIVSPLMARGEPIGVLEVYSEKAGNYIEDDIELLSLVANTAAIAISNAQLFQDARDHINRLQTLRRIDSVLNTSLENRESLNAITNEIIQHLGVDAIALSLYNEVDGFFRAETQQGFLPSIRIPPFALRHGAISQNIRTQSALLLRNTHEIPNDFERKTFSLVCGYELYAMVPIFAKGELKGILEVFQEQPMYPSSYWMSFLETIAGQLAIALQNINLFQNLQHINDELLHAYDATIEGWAHALDLRDEETKGHSQRVTGMTVRVAHALGMDSKQLVHLRRGALLHDIGKMGIPDSILHKPGPLTDEEWVMMKMHPEFAFQLLRDIPYLQPAIDIPYAHHEHWDGSGYPRGLKGEDIPLAARIFTIVDVWDALLSDRPYRNAWPSDQVRAYLEEKSGSQFDPEVVSTFLEVWSPRIVEKKPEILIVEKNADGELAKLQAYLEPTYKVYVTESEKAALDYLGSRNISLILIREDDLWASGVSLMRTAQDINPAILGILFANQLLPETLTKSINLPIVIGYMTLPIKVEDLQSKIEYALSEYKLNREIVHVSTKERTQMRAEASSNAAVLIVDDEPHVIRMLQHTLKKHFAVIAAKSGQEALTLMKKHEIAIVISDQSMPEMSGEVLLEQVAQLYPAVGTMLMSAAAQGEDLQVAFNTGNISGFFQKPLDPEQILVKVWHAYDRYQMRKRFANKEQDNE